MARMQSVDDKAVFVFVGDANSLHSECLELVSPTYRLGLDSLDFAICPVGGSWCPVPVTLLVIDSIL